MKQPEHKLPELVSRLQSVGGDNLISVVLYGSAVRDEFHERYSDVNLLAVFRDLGAGEIAAIAPVVRWWTQVEKFTPPLMMTEAELQESADVFAIEMLDIQHRHRTLFGKDIMSALRVPMNLHRLEVERELRTIQLRLRQHLLMNLENQDEQRRVLAKSIAGVTTLLRHALIAVGETPPQEGSKILEHAGAAFGFEAAAVQQVLALRSDHEHPANVTEVYNVYTAAIGRVVHELETLVPKRQWQRTSPTG